MPRAIRALLLAACVAAVLAVLCPTAQAAGCSRFAAGSGSDANPGTSSAPFRSAQKLSDSLSPGQTGCLAGGNVFDGPLRLAEGGQPSNPITITSGPGGRATIRGRIWFTPSAHDVTIENVLLDGRNPDQNPSPLISADRVVLRGNDITNVHTGICIGVGKSDTSYAVKVSGVVITGNRIHDCGRLPATNHDHGIYVESSTGTQIVGNWIFDNADRGIQLYPDADGTVVSRNVIDGNGTGVLFSGANGMQSTGNIVEDNVITNSVGHNVASFWDGVSPGAGNAVIDNCISGGHGAYGDVAPPDGFTVSGTVKADPRFVNRAAKDFRVPASSPCAGKVPDSVAAATPTSPVTPRPISGVVPTSPGGGPAAPGSPATAPDRRRPGLRLAALHRTRRPALRIVATDDRLVARVVVRGPGVWRTLVPRRALRRVATTVRFTRQGRVTVVAVDGVGKRRSARFTLG